MTGEQSIDSELGKTRQYTVSELRDMIEGTELLRFSEGTGRHEGRVMAVFDARDRQTEFGSDDMGGVGITFEIEGSDYPEKEPTGEVVERYDEVDGKPAKMEKDPITGEERLSLGTLTCAYVEFESGERFYIVGTRNLGVHEVEV